MRTVRKDRSIGLVKRISHINHQENVLIPILNLPVIIFVGVISKSRILLSLIDVGEYEIKYKIYSVYHFHTRFACFSYIKFKLQCKA
jgi:hypothetical protein